MSKKGARAGILYICVNGKLIYWRRLTPLPSLQRRPERIKPSWSSDLSSIKKNEQRTTREGTNRSKVSAMRTVFKYGPTSAVGMSQFKSPLLTTD